MSKKRIDTGYIGSLIKAFGIFLVCLWIVTSIYGVLKPLPNGIQYESESYDIPESDISFLYDITYLDENKNKVLEQFIFDEVFDMIENAQQYILIDMHLYNDFSWDGVEGYRALSSELTQALLSKKQQLPDAEIIMITDPINTVYGGDPSEYLELLESAGITVIETRLRELRESNFLYSGLYKIFFQWFGNSPGGELMGHPFSQNETVTIRSHLKLMQFKSNHRSVIMADDGNNEFYSIIGSANPYDSSSGYSNVAIKVRNSVFRDVFQSESAVGAFSDKPLESMVVQKLTEQTGPVSVKLLTEKKIKESLIREIRTSISGSQIDIIMHQLSDRDVISALIGAAHKGVDIRLVLDPTIQKNGKERNGIPNRQTAYELVDKSNGKIQIKWYEPGSDLNNAKMTLIHKQDGSILSIGSADLTRRSLDNYNLETNIQVRSSEDARVITDAQDFFDRIWNNENGMYSVSFETYEEPSTLKFFRYYLMEALGLSSF